MKRMVFFILAWLATILGCVGIFVPVLPTTPFLLLAVFLFAQSSPRCHTWLQSTKIYRIYVMPFKEAGGLALVVKVRILAVSFALMGISAVLAPHWYVWVTLACVALWLLFLMFVKIPTISLEESRALPLEQKDIK